MSRARNKKLLRLIVMLLLFVAVAVLSKDSLSNTTNGPGNSSGSNNLPTSKAPAGSLSLITEPSAGVAPVITDINNAKSSVDLVMYELEDSQVEQALSNAESRGVQVRVLLNGGYYGKPDKVNHNQAAYDYLQAHHVAVRWTPSYFALTHQKTLAVDGKTALIMTFNLTPQYYATGRDFGITDTDGKDVSAIETTFGADWQDNKLTAPSGDDLLWSPGSEQATIQLINSAKTSLNIYNEEMADTKVVSALGAAAMRGVNVKVVMTDQSSWHSNFAKLKSDGVHIRTYSASAPLYIHAKMIIADGKQAFIGSENFSSTSLTRNRELGLVFTDKTLVDQLNATFSGDYQNATTY
jgi:cardiolipin synthase A/B